MSDEITKAILAETYPTKKAALAAMEQVGLGRDGHDPYGLPGNKGWKIGKISKPDRSEGYVETYKQVVFSGRQSVTEPVDVGLAVNGELLLILREKPIIVPSRYLEAAEHATYPKFTQEPGKPRKTIGNVMRFPFTVIRDATKEEYDQALKEGTIRQAQNIRKYGFDVSPDQVDLEG